MTTNIRELEIEDPLDASRRHSFTLAPGEKGGKLFEIELADWEPADGKMLWRAPMHPWSDGLGADRIRPGITMDGSLKNRPAMNYAKSNGDASWENYYTAPPKLTTLGATVETNYANDARQLRYDGGLAYNTGPTYAGAGNSTPGLFHAIRNFNGKVYAGGGQYLYSMDASYNYAVIKDFGAGKTISDIEVFNGELVIAMGETEKLWTMSAAETFTQATDATYAIALGTLNDQLWRAESTNKLSNCITAPRTLASWVPASPNQYPVGDTTWSVTDLIEAYGVIVALKPDGVYFPDDQAEFRNQAPQMATYPHADNGKGAFPAWGALWVPSVSGLLRIAPQESIQRGPETAHRPDFRFWVRSGVEWNGDVYLLCTDEAETSQTFICKMMRTGTNYIFHEWARLGGISKGYFILVYTAPTNPTMIAGYGGGLQYWRMGRGTGPDVDDSNYEYGTSYELESGRMIPVGDLAIRFDLVGIKVVGKQPAGSTLRLYYQLDDDGIWHETRDTADGGGVTPISSSGYFVATRYALPNHQGNMLQLKLVGTLPTGVKGMDRPEIFEVFAFGNAYPDSTHVLTCGIYADEGARVYGLQQGKSSGDVFEAFAHWNQRGTVLRCRISDYAESQIIHAVVVAVKQTTVAAQADGDSEQRSSLIQLTLRRVDFAGNLN